jgi:alpha-1,3-glucosyltransferase
MLVAPRLGYAVDREAISSVTRGLVGDTSFAVLPPVSKEYTFALTFGFQLVGYCASSDYLWEENTYLTI